MLWRHLWLLSLHHIFRHYLINNSVFVNMLLNIIHVFWFSLQLLFETFLILSRTQWDIVINVTTSSCKELSEFNKTWIFSKDFRKKLKHQDSCKSVEWETSWSIRTDGQTRWSYSRFSQFCKLAKKKIHLPFPSVALESKCEGFVERISDVLYNTDV